MTNDRLEKVSVILPSLDPDEKLLQVIEGMLSAGFSDIILVNDGSKPENLHYFEEACKKHDEVNLIHHEMNKGKGAALKTAFLWFLKNRPKGVGVVTVDGDNQHRPDDTKACVEKMMENGSVVLGARDFNLPHVPPRSRFGNKTTSLVFRFFCGMKITDTQTGLRAIPRAALPLFTEVTGERFEYETNMLLSIKENGIPYEEVKCTTIYIEENKSSHFRAVRDSVRIYKLLLGHFFRYTIISLLSAILDEGIFVLLSKVLSGVLKGILFTGICTVGARLVSSLFNFAMNRKVVFESKDGLFESMLRYYLLAVPQLILQFLFTHGACILLGIGEEDTLLRALVYGVVMTVLFIMSYIIQKRWVFSKKGSNVCSRGRFDEKED